MARVHRRTLQSGEAKGLINEFNSHYNRFISVPTSSSVDMIIIDEIPVYIIGDNNHIIKKPLIKFSNT